jgi:YD repeat-containing protein
MKTLPIMPWIVYGLCAVALWPVSSAAQLGGEPGSPFQVNIIPPSPEASALAKYADIPVSLYTGTPNITIPLYDLRERDLSLPIALSYHASGHKVEDEASRVGLGWSLQAGGVITRSLRGFPDEYGPRGFLSQAAEMASRGGVGGYAVGEPEQRYLWYDAMVWGCRDAEPDVFYFNFAGYTGTFQFDWDGRIVIASASKLSITPIGLNPQESISIRGWEVITPDGRRFVFLAQETSSVRYSVSVADMCRHVMDQHPPAQSWYLTEIHSPATNSSISLHYDEYQQASERWSLETQIHNQFLAPAIPSKEKVTLSVHGRYVRRITTSSGETTVEFLPGMARTDVSSFGPAPLYTLGTVQVKDRQNTTIKQWGFGYDYRVGRLTLISLQEGSGEHTQPPYRFDYDGGTLPSPLSFAQDHWGFYNNNPKSTLIPATVAFRADASRVELDGANRAPAPGKLTVGMLSTITYPTGGSDRFEFEPHEYSFEQNRQLTAEVMEHQEVSGSAPGWDTPPGQVDVVTAPFTLSQRTDLRFVASFTCGCVFACAAYAPQVRIEESTGREVLKRVPPCVADQQGQPTYKTYDETVANVPPGQYTFSVSAKVPPAATLGRNGVGASLKWEVGTGRYVTLRKQGGGVRVAKITSTYGFGNPDKVRSYLYTKQEGNEEISSGSLVEWGDPVYEQWIPYVRAEGFGNIEERHFVRFSQNRTALGTTQGSHVGYSQVSVVYGAQAENGRTVYTYTSPIDHPDYISFNVPFPPRRSEDYQRGLVTAQVDYSAGSTTPTRVITPRYALTSHVITGLKVGWAKPSAGPALSGAGYLDRYAWEGYGNVLGYARLIETKIVLHDALGSTEHLTTSAYDEGGHKQVSTEMVIDSDGKHVVTRYTYPSDYPGGTSVALDRMVNDHVLDKTIEKVTYTQESATHVKVLSAVKHEYALFAGIPRLSQVQSARLGEPILAQDPLHAVQGLYEPRLIYHAYDAHGNVVEHSQPSGLRTVYIWGENATLPVAKVEHAKAHQVFYTSFEDVPEATTASAQTGTRSLLVGGSYAIPVARLPGEPGDYRLSYWKQVGPHPWVQEELTITNYQPGNPITTNAINGALDEVRLYPFGARMTTFTYQPLVGRTTETDVNGLSTSYEYDGFGRLVTVRDHRHNIRAHYEYHLGYAEGP